MIITCANAKCQRGREVRLQRERSAGAENCQWCYCCNNPVMHSDNSGYVSPTGTVIEHAVLQAAAGEQFLNDTLQIQSIDSVLSPYQYGNYEYIDYGITYEDTVNFYNPPLQVGK